MTVKVLPRLWHGFCDKCRVSLCCDSEDDIIIEVVRKNVYRYVIECPLCYHKVDVPRPSKADIKEKELEEEECCT
jgi:hypothetical protein